MVGFRFRTKDFLMQDVICFVCIHHLIFFKGEHQWLSSFADLSADETGDLTAHATLLFTQLYRVNTFFIYRSSWTR